MKYRLIEMFLYFTLDLELTFCSLKMHKELLKRCPAEKSDLK